MGNREALLLGAKRCLLEKGFARTTARDIAAAAGVSLAAIGYHFSSKEALLTEALLLAFGDWDQELRRALGKKGSASASPAQRFESTWARLIETFETHRSLWVANIELFSQMNRMPEIRSALGDNLQVARSELAALFLNEEQNAISEHTAQTIGKFHHVLLSGLIMQWLIDPEHALSAHDLTGALRTIAAGIETDPKSTKPKHKSSKRAKANKREPGKRR
jgi:AcrR family transcriptional regulator